MIECPYCGTRSSAIIDKRNGDGYVRRRRQCDDCGERFTTREAIVPCRPSAHDKAAWVLRARPELRS